MKRGLMGLLIVSNITWALLYHQTTKKSADSNVEPYIVEAYSADRGMYFVFPVNRSLDKFCVQAIGRVIIRDGGITIQCYPFTKSETP